jgi:HD-GYP domain-containing protein (c-di-GMP phosphodiesterase class II)
VRPRVGKQVVPGPLPPFTKVNRNHWCRMRKVTPIGLFVSLVSALAIAAAAGSTMLPSNHPGSLLEVVSFLVIAIILERSATGLRIHGRGSTSFVITLCACILFGASWAALVAASAMLVSMLSGKQPFIKTVFNTAQVTISVIGAVALYQLLNGQVPPSYLSNLPGVSTAAVQRDFALFFILALTYFLVNSVLVNAAIATASRRPFFEVWLANTRGVIGYDLAASALSMVMAWLFLWSQQHWGFGSIGILAVVVPIAFVRKTYTMYRGLEATSRELLEIMVKAIEARDPYTSGHSERVAKLSKLIAQENGGLGSDEIEKIYKAALLHDVGKMYEEFAPLLRKESKLTQEERELLQTHAIRSAELVGIVSDFKGTVLESVRSHHERWDGRGYPNGIAGEDIPLGARIIMVSDTIDAMTTDRPYRKALGVDVVIAELQKHRGTQFDPKLVDLVIGSVTIRRAVSLAASTHSPHAAGFEQPRALEFIRKAH